VNNPLEEMVPPLADHVTPVLLVPVTEAVNCCAPPSESETESGKMEIETDTGTVTVIVADADFVGSAALVAVTVNVPAALGAVYSPLDEMLPPLADQATAVLLVPVTEAVNCCVAPVESATETGEMEIETGTGTLTATVAEADLVGSAALVAVTVYVPAPLGAV